MAGGIGGKIGYDWKLIQADYDDGLTYNGLMEKWGMSSGALTKAVRRGDLKTKSKSEALQLYWEKRQEEIRLEKLRHEPPRQKFNPINEWHELVPIEDRRPDYIYDIGTGISQSYEFRLHPNDFLVVETVHNYIGAQDFSITAWFSERPIDPIMYLGTPYEWFVLCRGMNTINFKSLDSKCDGLPLQSHRTYWINFKNNQVLPNQFYLKFSH